MPPPIHQVFAGDPGVWSGGVGARAAAYLRSEAAVLDEARAAVEHVGDAVIVTGELAAVRAAVGDVPHVARALDAVAAPGRPFATVAVRLPVLLLCLAARGRIPLAARVLAEYKAPAGGVALLILLGGGALCLRMVTVDDDADALPLGSVGRGGDA